MIQNIIYPDAITGENADREFLAMAAASIYGIPVQEPMLNNTPTQQLPPLTPAIVPLQTYAATVIPLAPVPNVIQPTLVQQIPTVIPQQVLNHVQAPVPIPSISIQLQADAIQQNLLIQQQQQQQQQIQQIQQVHEQIQQIQQVQQQVQQVQQQQQQQQQVFPLLTIPQQIPAPQPIIHNLIPEHLQQTCLVTNPASGGTVPALIPNNNYVNAVNMILLASANNSVVGTTAAQIKQALIPPQQQPIVQIPLTVQDRPTIQPIFNGINLAYPGVEALGVDPPIFLVRDFLSHAECDFLIQAGDGIWQPAPVVGKGAGELSPSRTSSTCFLAREDLPDYMRKVSALTSKPVEHCELPQVGRYLPSQQYKHVRDEKDLALKSSFEKRIGSSLLLFCNFTQHFDAFDLGNEDGRRFAQNGGQRVVTVLVYLNDCVQGGQTDFPAMNIQVAPRKGTAVVFFPATVDGYLDKRALHAALPAIDTKYVSQVWVRQGNYTGTPSKRLATPMVNVSYKKSL